LENNCSEQKESVLLYHRLVLFFMFNYRKEKNGEQGCKLTLFLIAYTDWSRSMGQPADTPPLPAWMHTATSGEGASSYPSAVSTEQE
jgi:hypothetical protein